MDASNYEIPWKYAIFPLKKKENLIKDHIVPSRVDAVSPYPQAQLQIRYHMQAVLIMQ